MRGLMVLAALAMASAIALPNSISATSRHELQKLTASDAEAGDQFGVSVAASGDIAVVGAPFEDAGDSAAAGAAYVFQREAGGTDNWGEVTKLTASDAEAFDRFGSSVGASGDIVIVGAYLEDAGGTNAGAAYLFRRDAGGADNWGEVAKLTASDAGSYDRFAISVGVSGDIAIVGASAEDTGGNRAGAAYIFERDAGGADNWGEVTKLTASDAESFDRFGYSVAVSVDTAIVGAYLEDAEGTDAGAAYIFQRDAGGEGNWGEVSKLTASDGAPEDEFGISVAVDEDDAIVGAWLEDTVGLFVGAAYVFKRDGEDLGHWSEVSKLTASDARAFDRFGVSVGISEGTAVVGASGQAPGRDRTGAAYVLRRDAGGAGNWGEVAKLTASDGEADHRFGISVAISDSAAVAGAHFEDSRGDQSGAAYLFDLTRLRYTRAGDVDCSGTVDAIDVALVLQFVAALLGLLPCVEGADANDDDITDSLDAALILQFVAGLIDRIPADP